MGSSADLFNCIILGIILSDIYHSELYYKVIIKIWKLDYNDSIDEWWLLRSAYPLCGY